MRETAFKNFAYTGWETSTIAVPFFQCTATLPYFLQSRNYSGYPFSYWIFFVAGFIAGASALLLYLRSRTRFFSPVRLRCRSIIRDVVVPRHARRPRDYRSTSSQGFRESPRSADFYTAAVAAAAAAACVPASACAACRSRWFS